MSWYVALDVCSLQSFQVHMLFGTNNASVKDIDWMEAHRCVSANNTRREALFQLSRRMLTFNFRIHVSSKSIAWWNSGCKGTTKHKRCYSVIARNRMVSKWIQGQIYDCSCEISYHGIIMSSWAKKSHGFVVTWRWSIHWLVFALSWSTCKAELCVNSIHMISIKKRSRGLSEDCVSKVVSILNGVKPSVKQWLICQKLHAWR